LEVLATLPALLRLPLLLVTGVGIILKMTISLLLPALLIMLSLFFGEGLLYPPLDPLDAENAFPEERMRRNANNNLNKFFIAAYLLNQK
jgi:hypothetical protein